MQRAHVLRPERVSWMTLDVHLLFLWAMSCVWIGTSWSMHVAINLKVYVENFIGCMITTLNLYYVMSANNLNFIFLKDSL